MHTTVLPTDKRVTAKMAELAVKGVRRVGEMQRHIKMFVENELFAGQTAPPVTDSRFWPNGKAVLNCIYSATKRARFAHILAIV